MSAQNFEFLARETLLLTEKLRKEAFSYSDRNFSLKKENSFHSVSDEKPLGPGVIYRLEKGVSTFCLRGVPTEDMDWEREKLERRDRDLIKDLRLDESLFQELREGDTLHFFSTPEFSFAQALVKQLANRRFPRQESMICNLSDPGFSWWLSLGEWSLTLYFQSHGIERDEDLIQLGPLGDPFTAFEKLKKAFSFFKSQFPLYEFSATEKRFTISSGSQSLGHFEKLQKIFTHGEFHWKDKLQDSSYGNHHELLFYLYELSLLRKFWFEVQEILSS